MARLQNLMVWKSCEIFFYAKQSKAEFFWKKHLKNKALKFIIDVLNLGVGNGGPPGFTSVQQRLTATWLKAVNFQYLKTRLTRVLTYLFHPFPPLQWTFAPCPSIPQNFKHFIAPIKPSREFP